MQLNLPSARETLNANLAKCKFLCTIFSFSRHNGAFHQVGRKAIFITIFYGYYIDEIFMITDGACKIRRAGDGDFSRQDGRM